MRLIIDKQRIGLMLYTMDKTSKAYKDVERFSRTYRLDRYKDVVTVSKCGRWAKVMTRDTGNTKTTGGSRPVFVPIYKTEGG